MAMKLLCSGDSLQKGGLQFSVLQNGREGRIVDNQRKYVSLGKDLCQSFDNPFTTTTRNEPVVNNGNAKLRQLWIH